MTTIHIRPHVLAVSAAAALVLFAGVFAAPVRAQETPAEEAAAVNPDLVMTADEELLAESDPLLAKRKTINVSEQYRNLLTREAISIKPSERPDPMVVPFINDKVVLEKMSNNMEENFALGNQQLALIYAKQIAKRFPNAPEARRAMELIEIIKTSITPDNGDLPSDKDPKLNRWVAANTKAILYDAENPSVLIGVEVLKVGDAVPDYPDHVIDEIRADSVIFRVSNEFRTKRIELNVSGTN